MYRYYKPQASMYRLLFFPWRNICGLYHDYIPSGYVTCAALQAYCIFQSWKDLLGPFQLSFFFQCIWDTISPKSYLCDMRFHRSGKKKSECRHNLSRPRLSFWHFNNASVLQGMWAGRAMDLTRLLVPFLTALAWDPPHCGEATW